QLSEAFQYWHNGLRLTARDSHQRGCRSMRSMRRIVVAIFAITMLAGSTGTDAMAAPAGVDRVALQQAMNEVVAAGAAGVQMRVHDEHGEWAGSAGVTELGRPDGVPTDGQFRIGSITKTFTATVLLQLVGEGRLGLDDPVDRYLPQFGLDPRITVRMLLQHTSGLFNDLGDRNPDGTMEPGFFPSEGKAGVDSLFRDYQPEELVRFALSKPARFAPGTGWSYSNTNYILVGLLIEKITGTPYALQIYGRIVVPLGLWGTTVPGHWTGIPGPHAHGYTSYLGDGVVTVVDVTDQNPSAIYAAGEIVSTTRDLDTFMTALLGGRLLTPVLLAEMRKGHPFGPNPGYGLGLGHGPLEPGCDVVGHDGGVAGYLSEMYSTTERGRRVEMSVTKGPGVDLDDAAAYKKFSMASDKVAATALCDG
ncbi:serine hydrolase domain-containing protein, partial [Nocardia sp. NPDC051570]|uniref:serine hydrolase domain-containing protein n=1 Tax=Nocardia sp. NPDC051570 TaxID=3364324 RepID=UPI0037A75BA8